MTYPIRPYQSDLDKEAVHRIWQEIGWVTKEQLATLDIFLETAESYVTTINNTAECFTATGPGTVYYQQEPLDLTLILAVTTSRIARKQGLARRLTAHAIAQQAAKGAQVATLGIFDQGFYNQLGFGNGSYVIRASFDPAQLNVKKRHRIPQRFTAADWEKIHAARARHVRGHGACVVHPPQQLRAEMMWASNGFALGYTDEADNISHHFWVSTDDVEHGPYRIWWIDFETGDQLIELLALIKSLGDQVRLVTLQEPAGIQLQDFLNQPFKYKQISQSSKYAQTTKATAYWQMRICDLEGCLRQTHLPGPSLRFNLTLTDPITPYLPTDTPWQGLNGDYTITLGPQSSATLGHGTPGFADKGAVPLLKASIGAFTRLWLGVRPATGLAISDDLSAPPELLAALDQKLRLPTPIPNWEF